MHYNICVIRPAGYPHSDAFTELAELVAYGLEDLGHVVERTENTFRGDARNIMIGCHLVDPQSADHVPGDTIIVNTEQIHVDEQPWNQKIYFWTARHETWDYSARNVDKLRSLGITHVKLLRIGFHPKLRRIRAEGTQDIDVLFYGTLGPRRIAVLEALHARGLKVHVVNNLYGSARDALIARSKVVLNLHHYASHIFEAVRVFYLMSNAKAIVGEVSPSTSIDPAYVGGFHAAGYDALVDACVDLVHDTARRKTLEAMALRTIARYPQAQLLAPLLYREAVPA